MAVAVAQSWKGTPYVFGARVKGAGCDCGSFVAQWFVECGLANEEDLSNLHTVGVFGHDWFCNTGQELYFDELARHARCIWQGQCAGTPPAKPGDVAIFRVAGSKIFNHGCIITGWPRALHAFDKGVCESRPAIHPLTSHQDMALFDPWA